ncbi:MAG: SAM-dependent methyltransferase [Acidimicrobiales bacterium]
MTAESITDRLEALIAGRGPIPVSDYIEEALYGPDGFYMVGGQAGRRGDFLTAPEVGPLFGAVVARAVDHWWRELGSPTEFTVLEWGAGPGTLARGVLAANPEVLSSGALRWFMVERSPEQHARHPVHERFSSALPDDVPGVDVGVVLANELLDNLAFDIVERTIDGWAEILVDAVDGAFVERRAPAQPMADMAAGTVPVASRLPRQRQARAWLTDAKRRIDRGRVVVFDYGATSAELAARDGAWLRTHAGHTVGADWLATPGSCDITADVDLDQLQLEHPADRHECQSEWLRRFGIDELVEEGREIWAQSAGVGDLAALTARSRIREAEALCDPGGMGGFHVLEWAVGPPVP